MKKLHNMDSYINEVEYESFKKAKALNESADDPETNPYKSKYEARTILQDMRDHFNKLREDNEDVTLKSIEGTLEFYLGVNYVYTEEVSAGEERLQAILCIFNEELSLLPNVVSLLIATHNELGVLWSSRQDGTEKAHMHLMKAESLYFAYNKSSDESPFSLDHHFLEEKPGNVERRKIFDILHTHTLYFLAQVFKNLGKSEESAMYCMKTLRRQLILEVYKPMEWALNCACLSQYYIARNKFQEAKHCLSCASFIEQQEKYDPEDERFSRLEETRADISRCWVKYCVCLLEESKGQLSNDIGELDENLRLRQIASQNSQNDDKSFERFSLEVTSIKETVSHDYTCTSDQAKKVFLVGKKHAENALKYFVLDGFVTDFVELHQDISHLYQHLAFFESSGDIVCRMQKRRVDTLIPVLKELNPQYYLAVCRQLQFEIGEIYNEMLSVKLEQSRNRENTLHATKKIISLCESGITYFKMFLNTCKTNGLYPEQFESDIERPALLAHFYLARFFSKKPAASISEKVRFLKDSLDNYSFIASYVDRNEGAEEAIKVELQICREMVVLLPQSMEQLISSS